MTDSSMAGVLSVRGSRLSSTFAPDGALMPLPQGLKSGAAPQSQPGPLRAKAALSGAAPRAFPYDASSWVSQDMSDWLPDIRSPDYEINIHRNRMVARARDLERNDGWAKGAVNRILDNALGLSFRLLPQPDYRALAFFDKGFDAVWAREYRAYVEAKWRIWAYGPDHFNDVTCQLNWAAMNRLALRHKLIDGESLAVNYWMPERKAEGARFAIAVNMIDPDLLSNPYEEPDTRYMRGGVELDDNARPIAYHIRKAHPYDYYNAVESMEWERIPKVEAGGWQRVVHDFNRDRVGQNRGLSIFTPVISRLKMLAKYDQTELQAAIINATFGAYIKSPYDPDFVQDALDPGTGSPTAQGYQDFRDAYHQGGGIKLNGSRIPLLAPGESLETISATRPATAFDGFQHAILRCIAAATGESAEQITQDWSRTNYSSARAAMQEAFKSLVVQRQGHADGFATPVYSSWLYELHDDPDLPLPKNAPAYLEAKAEYSRCRWIGPGRGWVDPVKEKQGAILGLDAGLETLEGLSADLVGADWEETLDQRAYEIKAYADRGIPAPTWANVSQDPGGGWGGDPDSAHEVAAKPQAN